MEQLKITFLVHKLKRESPALWALLTKRLDALFSSKRIKEETIEVLLEAAYLEGYSNAQKEIYAIMANDTRKAWNENL